MSKSLMISIRPKHLVNILNGNKTLELRKNVPKDFKGWVYLYCTKARQCTKVSSFIYVCDDELYKLPNGKIKYGSSVELMSYEGDEYNKNNFLNGKVVARFWFDETYYIKQAVNVYGDELNQISIYDNKSYGWKTPKEQQEILKQLCLTEQEVLDYVKGKGANAWHIKQLEIFDEPLSLSDFYKANLYASGQAIKEYEKRTNDFKSYRLKKAPQSWRYVYYAN